MCAHLLIFKLYFMLLTINGERFVKDIQLDFSMAYPYLRLEFFRINGMNKNQAVKQNQVKHDQQLRLAKGVDIKKGDLLIEDSMSVAELEKAFKDKFGLLTQVFRRSGNIWLETTITDSWSLRQQNDLGKEITMGKTEDKKNDEDEDYDLNRNQD